MLYNTLKVLFLFLVISSAAIAQTGSGNLTVTSSPAGTAVMLDGEYELAGVTPVTFNQKLFGVYKLTALRGGYEKYQTTLVLVGDEPRTIKFDMVPKTRSKAAFRSLLIPGWGQMYSGQKLRGAAYTFGAAASLLTLAIVDNDFRDKKDEFNRLNDAYVSARSIDEKRRLKVGVDDAQQAAYDAESSRNIVFGVAALIWAFNVIDAAAFFPESGYSVGGPTAISIDTGEGFDRVQLKLAVNF
ncbi:MAG: DUF5683 domain-containing protein [Candidatus Zixiibacteriota bacterium]